MPVLAFLNQKGGVGKTTLVTNVATALAIQKQRVLFIDADQQGSALDWSAARKGELLFPVVGLPKDTLHREIPALGEFGSSSTARPAFTTWRSRPSLPPTLLLSQCSPPLMTCGQQRKSSISLQKSASLRRTLTPYLL